MGVREKTYVAGIISCFPNIHFPPASPIQAKAPPTIEAGYASYTHFNVLL